MKKEQLNALKEMFCQLEEMKKILKRKEQLNALKEMFCQLEEMKKILKRYEEDRFRIVASIDGSNSSNDILNKIVKKYTKNVVEDLKEEIKKRETELESIKKRIKASQILSIQIKEEEKPKFDPNTLKPFQQVLVRNEDGCIWLARFYDFNERELGEGERFVTTSGGIYNKCIPYNDETKHLHGTTDEEPEFYRI